MPPPTERWNRAERRNAAVFAASVAVLCAVWLFGLTLRARLFSLPIDTVRRSGIARVFDSGVTDLVNVTLVIAAATAAYLLALWALRRGFRHSFAAAISGCVLGAFAFMPSMPLTSPDAVHLAADVRTFWLFQRNPTVRENAPAAIDDPVTQQVAVFKGDPSGYGPLSYAIGGAPLPFVGDSLRANILGVKIVAGAFLLATAVLAGLMARRLGQNPGLITAAVGLNPLMLWQFPGDGHNDSIMAAFGMLALLFVVRSDWSSRGIGLAAGLASVASKFALVLAAPVVAGAWFPRLRPAFAALACIGGVGVWLVFVTGHGPNIGTAGPAFAVAQTTPWGVLSNAVDANHTAREWFVGLAYLMFGAVSALVLLRHRLEEPQDIVAAVGLVMWFFLFACSPGLLPWYQVWYLPFAFLSGRRWLIAASLVFSVGGFLPILALNWKAAIIREMDISSPVDRAVVVLWVAVGATALGVYWAGESRRRRAAERGPRRPQRRPARRRA